jgi:hypothetical protein
LANKQKIGEKIHLQTNKIKTLALIFMAILISSIVPMIMPIQSAKGQLAAQQPVSGPIPAGITVARQSVTRASLSKHVD